MLKAYQQDEFELVVDRIRQKMKDGYVEKTDRIATVQGDRECGAESCRRL